MTVQWSRNQDLLLLSLDDVATCRNDDRLVEIRMTNVATPDFLQSEAYISTVALYLIFSSSPKEEKSYLRLPSIWREFWSELADKKRTQDDDSNRNILRGLRNLINETQEAGQGKHIVEEQEPSEHRPGEKTQGRRGFDKKEPISAEALMSQWRTRILSHQYIEMIKCRMRLPIWNFKDEILDIIKENPIVIICGETGCGKSTQVPSFLLEHGLSNGQPWKVFCAEPRRISAISLARRVSEELGEKRGELGGRRSLVGYSIRFESKMGPDTRLIYVTIGIIMRMLENSSELIDITHLVVDEVHERSIDSDFLLIVLRKLLVRRPSLKVILISATINAQKFSSYLNNAPVINVPGRTFPVDTRYLEDAIELTKYSHPNSEKSQEMTDLSDYEEVHLNAQRKSSVTLSDLSTYSMSTRSALMKFNEHRIDYGFILSLLDAVATKQSLAEYSKAILVFLPGLAEIRRLNGLLFGHRTFSEGWRIHALHSTIAMEEQELAFLIPPHGIRKIVLATNIAETGVTIPDITCVIDTGKHREMRYVLLFKFCLKARERSILVERPFTCFDSD